MSEATECDAEQPDEGERAEMEKELALNKTIDPGLFATQTDDQTDEHIVHVGDTFDTSDEAQSQLHADSVKTCKPIITRSSSSTVLHVKCPHGVYRRKRTTTNSLRKQHVLFTGCKAECRLSFSKTTGKWRVTKMVTKHNHTCNAERFRLYTQQRQVGLEEEQRVGKLVNNYKVKPSIAAKTLSEETGQYVSTKQVQNIAQVGFAKIRFRPNLIMFYDF